MTPEPIRVCHIMTADLWAGAEVQLATLASYLVTRPDIELSAVLFNDGWLARELRTLGVPVAIVDERRRSAPAVVRETARWLRAHRVEIVHTHRSKDNVLGTLAAKLSGVRHIVRTVHGRGEPVRGWDLVKWRVHVALDLCSLWCCADRVVAVSRRMAEKLEHDGYATRTLIHVHNGIDVEKVRVSRNRADVRHALGCDDDTFLIGTSGRFAPVKGHQYLLRAAARLMREEPRTRLVFIGSGPLENELRALAQQLGIESAVRIVNPATDERFGVFDLIAALDVFTLPSLDEGIPMALLEAMALERPVVASAVGGVPEIVTHQMNGLLVEPKDAGDLAAACLRLIRNPHFARSLALRGRRTVEREFSRERNGERMLEEYRTVARGKTSPQPRIGAATLCVALVQAAAAFVHRRIERALLRRAMTRLRRRPLVLLKRLADAENVLVVCHGNIIRSAFAARLIVHALGNRHHRSVSSAGLAAIAGRPSHPTAVSAAAPLGIDLREHRASPVSPAAVAAADVILVMDVPQLAAIHRRFPESRGKTFLLACLAGETPLEVRDPVDGDEPVFQACFKHISSAVQPITRALLQAQP